MAAASMDRPHLVGIGGAGMSGIAKILAMRGAKVAGSDSTRSATVLALQQLGATVHIGHAAENLADDASCVIVSSAIRADNPETAAATARGIPIIHRADALAALMEGRRAIAVAGTHGKTTTTGMLAVGLTELGLDPSFAIGGDIDEPGSNAHHGTGEIFVAEADESDRSFHKYSPEVAIVLNVELDHHATYGSLEEVHDSFVTFVERITPGGTLVVSADHPGAQELTSRVAHRRDLTVLRVGDAEDADVRVLNRQPHGLASEVSLTLPKAFGGGDMSFTVSAPGRHYAYNAVAAITAGAALGVPAEELGRALARYPGVRRRLQIKGTARGVQVIDSYAHHPTEIAADLEAVRSHGGGGRVVVVFQPHLFSRTASLGEEIGTALTLADAVVVLDIYPAREDPVPGVTSDIVVKAAARHDVWVRSEPSMAAVPDVIEGLVRAGDLVLTMGAGDVTGLGPRILARLKS